jgi:solute carrier family 12 (sodium/potassium/chloride transporter), member 2
MFFLSWQSSIITLGLLAALYWMVAHRQPDANWGSSTQEQTYRTMLSAIFRLQQTGEHIKNYHPQILILSGNPISRPTLIELGGLLTNNSSLLLVGDVYKEKLSYTDRCVITDETYMFMSEKKIKGFYNLIDDIDMNTGVRLMVQSTGFGVLSPNIIMMGYKSDWPSCNSTQIQTYYHGIQ